MKYTEAERREEAGYRRGFDQAMYVVIQLLKEGKTLNDIQDTKQKVYKWRYNGKYGKNDIRIAPPVKLLPF